MWENSYKFNITWPCAHLESAESTSIIRMSGQVPPSTVETKEPPFELTFEGFSDEEDSEFVISPMYLTPSAICTYYKNEKKLSDITNKRIECNYVSMRKTDTFVIKKENLPSSDRFV